MADPNTPAQDPNAVQDPYASYGGSVADASNTDPYAAYGGSTAQQPEQGTVSKVLGVVKQAVAGPNTALATETPQGVKEEGSGLSDIFHGDIRQGLGKIVHAETPHVVAGSRLEKLIQQVKPDFHGAATPEWIAQEEKTNALNRPLVDAAQFIDKDKHPVSKAVAEAAQSLTSPGTVAILAGTGGLGLVESPQALAVANKLLSAGFSAVAIGQAYKNFRGFKEAYDAGNSNEAMYQLTHGVMSGALAYAAGKNAAGEPLPSPTEKAVAGKVVEAVKAVPEQIKEVAGKAGEKIGGAVEAVKETPAQIAEKFRVPVEPAKPVSPHVSVETPLDDAAIRKSVNKDLSTEARQTLRKHVGDTVPAGSSVENTLMKAVKPVNDVIVQKGLELNKVLEDAPHFDTTPTADIQNRIGKFKSELPGGTEETLGKAVDKEVLRARDVMQSSEPVEINNYIRDLDKRINSYNAPEEPLNNPSDAADATRVLIRRALRDKLNTEIPATKPINDVLGKNLELRGVLRKKFGDVAHDPVAAEAQHASELGKGQKYMEYEQKLADHKRVMNAAGYAVKSGVTAALGISGWEVIKHLFGL